MKKMLRYPETTKIGGLFQNSRILLHPEKKELAQSSLFLIFLIKQICPFKTKVIAPKKPPTSKFDLESKHFTNCFKLKIFNNHDTITQYLTLDPAFWFSVSNQTKKLLYWCHNHRQRTLLNRPMCFPSIHDHVYKREFCSKEGDGLAEFCPKRFYEEWMGWFLGQKWVWKQVDVTHLGSCIREEYLI